MPSFLPPPLSKRRHARVSSAVSDMSSVEHSTKQISIHALGLFILFQRLIKNINIQLAGLNYPVQITPNDNPNARNSMPLRLNPSPRGHHTHPVLWNPER